MELFTFILFILCVQKKRCYFGANHEERWGVNDNPANILKGLVGGLTAVEASPWKLEMAAALLRWRGSIQILREWAAIEQFNAGSIQRAETPSGLVLKGTGRWLANDNGGHWRLLLKAVVAWEETSEGLKKSFAIAGKIFYPTIPVGQFEPDFERLAKSLEEEAVRRRKATVKATLEEFFLGGWDEQACGESARRWQMVFDRLHLHEARYAAEGLTTCDSTWGPGNLPSPRSEEREQIDQASASEQKAYEALLEKYPEAAAIEAACDEKTS